MNQKINFEELKYEFALETEHDADALHWYLIKYPEYRYELLDLAADLILLEAEDKEEESSDFSEVDDPGLEEALARFWGTQSIDS